MLPQRQHLCGHATSSVKPPGGRHQAPPADGDREVEQGGGACLQARSASRVLTPSSQAGLGDSLGLARQPPTRFSHKLTNTSAVWRKPGHATIMLMKTQGLEGVERERGGRAGRGLLSPGSPQQSQTQAGSEGKCGGGGGEAQLLGWGLLPRPQEQASSEALGLKAWALGPDCPFGGRRGASLLCHLAALRCWASH